MPRKVTMQDVRQDAVVRKHVIGLFLCGVALLLDIALSFSPMFWFHKVTDVSSSNTRTISVGLWKGCMKNEFENVKPTTRCWEHDDKEFPFAQLGKAAGPGAQLAKSLGVTQLFQCLGLLFLTVPILTTILKLYIWRENNILTPMGAVHAFWGAVSFIGSAGAFGTGLKKINTPTDDYTENLHFSFAFAVISGFVALAGAVALLVAAKTTNEPSDEKDPESTNRLEAES